MIIDRNTLSHALANAARIAPGHPMLPVLANVKLSADDDMLIIGVTCLDMSLNQIITPVAVTEPFDTTVDARKLAEVVNAMDGATVELTKPYKDGQWLAVKSGAAEVKLQGIDPQEFPSFPEMPQKRETVDAEGWSEAVSRVLSAASTEEARPVLQGVYSDGSSLTATDGFRIHTVEFGMGKALIPARALANAARLFKRGDVAVSVTNSQWFISDGNTALVSQIIDGNFPDWRAILSDMRNTAVVEIDVARLNAGVKRVFPVAGKGVVKITASDGHLTIEAHDEETGNAEDTMDAQITGAVPVFALNGRFLLDALGCARANSVRINVTRAVAPVVIEDGTGWKAVIMPMAVQ